MFNILIGFQVTFVFCISTFSKDCHLINKIQLAYKSTDSSFVLLLFKMGLLVVKTIMRKNSKENTQTELRLPDFSDSQAVLLQGIYNILYSKQIVVVHVIIYYLFYLCFYLYSVPLPQECDIKYFFTLLAFFFSSKLCCSFRELRYTSLIFVAAHSFVFQDTYQLFLKTNGLRLSTIPIHLEI